MKSESTNNQPNSPLKKLLDAFGQKRAGEKIDPAKSESPSLQSDFENVRANSFSLHEQLDNKPFLSYLIKRLKEQSGRKTGNPPAQKNLPPELIEQETTARLAFLYNALEALSAEFNASINRDQYLKALHITCARFVNERENNANSFASRDIVDDWLKCRITCANQSLSLRGARGVVEIYMQPADLLFLGNDGEIQTNLKFSLVLQLDGERLLWMKNGLPASGEEQILVIQQLFQDLTANALGERKKLVRPSSMPFSSKNEDKTLEDLVLSKQNLVNKLVNRHEELTTAIARDLHDSVIADVLHLKRKVTGQNLPNGEELIEILDRLNKSLREICYDLAPRDLEDWGLPTVIEDLVERVAKETTAQCQFMIDREPPNMERPVQLQLFRIVQESLNNAAKYSKAENITVSLHSTDDSITLKIEDDGIGFSDDANRRREILEGGAGLTGIRERTEMIRCFHPVQLDITSTPGQGTRIELSISIR